MNQERFRRRVITGIAATAFALTPLEAVARPGTEQSQTIVPGAASDTVIQPTPAPFSTTPLTRRVLEVLFRDNVPGITRTHVVLGEGDDGYVSSFHALDSHGRMKLFELLLTVNLQHHPDLMIRECDDTRRDEIRQVPLCDQEDESSVTFNDYGADGIIDSVQYKRTTPDLLGNTELNMETGTAAWNQPDAQRTYEREQQTISRASLQLGFDRM